MKILNIKKTTIACIAAMMLALPAFAEATYEDLDYIELDCKQYQNYKLPYYIPAADTAYSWEMTLSDIGKNENSCGSFCGVYDFSSKRSGYFYSAKDANATEQYFQVCVGSKHLGTKFYLFDKGKNTIHADYTSTGSGGTYSVWDTLGLVAPKDTPDTGNWTGQYAWGPDYHFGICSCCTYETVRPASEYLSMKFYEMKIWEKDENGQDVLKMDVVPKKKTEGTLVSIVLYDKVTKVYIETEKPTNLKKVTFDDGDANNPGSEEIGVVNGMPMTNIKIPVKPGYYFEGYYSQEGGKGTQYYDHEGKPVGNWDQTGDATLYAYWTVCTHQHKTSETGKAATCTEDGLKDHPLCTDCQAMLDASGNTAAEGTYKIPKLGHDWKYTANGNIIIASCSRSASCKQADVTITLKLSEYHKAMTLKAILDPEDSDSSVTWSSSDENVVKVDKNGKITAVGVGKATVTATSDDDDDVKGTCTVDVAY